MRQTPLALEGREGGGRERRRGLPPGLDGRSSQRARFRAAVLLPQVSEQASGGFSLFTTDREDVTVTSPSLCRDPTET